MNLSSDDTLNSLRQFAEEVRNWSDNQEINFKVETLYSPYLKTFQNYGALFEFPHLLVVRRSLTASIQEELKKCLKNDIVSWKNVDRLMMDYLLAQHKFYPTIPMSTAVLAELVIENNYPIEDLIGYFNNRLQGKQHEFACRVFLHGIALGDYDGHNIHPPTNENIALGSVKLRPIQEQDILPRIRTGLQSEYLIEPAHSVLEWSIRTPPTPLQIAPLRYEILKYVKRFRLVFGGKWVPTKWYLQSLESPWISEKRPYHGLYEKKYIDKGGVFIVDMKRKEDFKKLNYIIEKRLSDNSYQAERVSMTLEKWEEAVYKESIDSVCNCVVGLETIFKKKERERGLTAKIPKRVASMIKSTGLSDTIVSALIDDAYEIRNDGLHGEKADEELASKIDSDVFECVRRAMLVWLQTRSRTQSEMKKLIDRLDSLPENVKRLVENPLF